MWLTAMLEWRSTVRAVLFSILSALHDLRAGFLRLYPKTARLSKNVRASKLNECQPVSCLLRPTSAQTTTLDEPRNRALHYPSPRWINSSCRALIRRKLDVLSSRIDLDMRLVAPGS